MKELLKHVVIGGGTLLVVVVLSEIVLLLVLQRQTTAYPRAWKDRPGDASHANPIVVLGDSTGLGIGASSIEYSYAAVFSRMAATSDTQSKIYNYSKSGARIAELTREQLPAFKADDLQMEPLVIVAIGANDMVNFDAQRFRTDYENMLSQLPQTALIGDVPYFGGGRFRGRELQVQSANQIIAELTQKHGFRRAKIYEITKAQDSWRNYAADFFHPSNRAYKLWAEAFFEAYQQPIPDNNNQQ